MSRPPLDGLRVLDFTTEISGPAATSVFAEFGADVIAVEHPTKPNPLRTWDPMYEEESLWWKSLGRNKRSITLDLSVPEGQELALRLVEDADVVYENFRPGTMERWGLGFEELKNVNKAIIMVRISGYGQTGPKSDQGGYGTVAESITGWAHNNGYPDDDPLLPPIPLADLSTAMFSIFSTMFAIYERDVIGSGEGQVIDIGLYEPLLKLFISHVEAYDSLGLISTRTGNRSTSSAPRNLYAAKDGYIAMSASSQPIFENVMDAINRPELVSDPRFATNRARLENVEELDAIIEDWTSDRTTAGVAQAMDEANAIVGPVYEVSEIVADEHFQARDNFTRVQDPDVGEILAQNVVPKLSRTPGSLEFLGPSHGEYNEAVFIDELDVDRSLYEELRGKDVI